MPRVIEGSVKGVTGVVHQTQHGMKKGRLGQEGDEAAEGENPRTYIMTFTVKERMTFTAKDRHRPGPFEGCSGQASTIDILI